MGLLTVISTGILVGRDFWKILGDRAVSLVRIRSYQLWACSSFVLLLVVWEQVGVSASLTLMPCDRGFRHQLALKREWLSYKIIIVWSRLRVVRWSPAYDFELKLTLPLPSSKSTFSQAFKEKCISEVVRIVSIIIFHLSKVWKAKFFILCDVIFLVRLQGKFDIDHCLFSEGRVAPRAGTWLAPVPGPSPPLPSPVRCSVCCPRQSRPEWRHDVQRVPG